MADIDRNGDLEIRIVDASNNTIESELIDGKYHLLVKSSGAVDLGLYVKDDKLFGYGTNVNTASAGTDNPLILLKNPSDSGKNLILYSVVLGISIENNYGVYKIFIDPTISSNGTSETILNKNIGSSVASVMELYQIPTIIANGILNSSYVYGANSNSVIINANFSLLLQPGHNLLITGDPKSNNRTSQITLTWVEETI